MKISPIIEFSLISIVFFANIPVRAPIILVRGTKMLSNCLFEAVKAKLRNWKEVKIHKIPAKFSNEIFPHFWWSIGDKAYDFKSCKSSRRFQVLLFKGEIRADDLMVFESFVAHKAKSYIKKIETKYKVADYVAGTETIVNSNAWELATTKPEASRKISIVIPSKGTVETKYIDSNDLEKYPEAAYWRYEDQLAVMLAIDFD